MNRASVEFVIEQGPVALLYSAKGTALRERREDHDDFGVLGRRNLE